MPTPAADTLHTYLPAPLEPAAVLDDPLEQDCFTRPVLGPAGQRWAESALQLSGLYCAACSGIIEAALLRVSGVQRAQVSAASERATVCWDPSRTRPSALISAVRSAGYDAVPDAAAPARLQRLQAQRQALWRLGVAVLCALQVMMLAAPTYFAAPGEISADALHLLNWASWLLTLPVLAFAATPFFAGAWQGLRARRLSMDLPVALGIGITFVASSGASVDPGGVFGSAVYFDSLTMFISFLLGARWLELRTRHHAAEELERSLGRLPETAWLVDEAVGVEQASSDTAVSSQRLRVGDLVRVPLGQAFPADGLVHEGMTQANEALLSGESAPVDKPCGAAVLAGSVNLGAPVLVRVQRVGSDTRLRAIQALMHSALAQRPATARLADRWAAPFLWAVLLLAAAAAALWSVIDPPRALWVAVSVLIVTCPCALSLAAPATLVAAVRGMARRGVRVQRLDAIEALAGATHFFFDKTGTLTEDHLQWRGTELTQAGRSRWADPSLALDMAASLAVWSAHPVARALGEQAHATRRWWGVHEEPGLGLRAVDEHGRPWRLGSARWAGVGADPRGSSQPQVWLACEGQALASFTVDEVLREGALQTLQALQQDGVHITLLSGDSAHAVQAVAHRLNVSRVLAAATPQAKLDALAAVQSAGGRVVMVGDGINDAPVMARADVSLAMGQGAFMARGQADAVITSNRLQDLLAARRTAQRAMAIVRQNFVWAAAYNGLCIPLALAGWLPPWAAGLGMALSSLFVVLNAQRAAR